MSMGVGLPGVLVGEEEENTEASGCQAVVWARCSSGKPATTVTAVAVSTRVCAVEDQESCAGTAGQLKKAERLYYFAEQETSGTHAAGCYFMPIMVLSFYSHPYPL